MSENANSSANSELSRYSLEFSPYYNSGNFVEDERIKYWIKAVANVKNNTI